MLETIREYAFERLRELARLDELRRRHAEHFLGFAEQAHVSCAAPGRRAGSPRSTASTTNLRAAIEYVRGAGEKELELRFVAALWFFWIVHGHLTEGMTTAERALEGSHSQPPLLRADALRTVAALAHRLGDTRRAKMYAKESVGLYREVGDLGGEAAALTTLAGAALVEGDGARARELYEQALDTTRNLNDPFRLASALGNLGYLLLMEGDNERAAKLFEEGLIVFRRLSSEEGVARSLLNLGFAAWQRLGVLRGGGADEGEPAPVRDDRLARGHRLLPRGAGRGGHVRGERRARRASAGRVGGGVPEPRADARPVRARAAPLERGGGAEGARRGRVRDASSRRGRRCPSTRPRSSRSARRRPASRCWSDA